MPQYQAIENCKNCAAPLSEMINGKCSYCGTIYFIRKEKSEYQIVNERMKKEALLLSAMAKASMGNGLGLIVKKLNSQNKDKQNFVNSFWEKRRQEKIQQGKGLMTDKEYYQCKLDCHQALRKEFHAIS